MMTFNAELTDTFAGEANYSWVRRVDATVPDGASNLAIVRAAKKALGINGIRCTTHSYGDMIEIRPRGRCLVAFVTFPS